MQQLCLVWRTGAGPWLWNTTLAVRNGSGVAIEIFVCGPEPSLIEPLPQLRPGEVRVYDAVTATLICGGVFAFRDGIDLDPDRHVDRQVRQRGCQIVNCDLRRLWPCTVTPQ